MTEFSKETKEKIEMLQMSEQRLHSLLTQKQTFQSQLIEVENALAEIDSSKGQIYRIIGNIMVSSDKDKTKEDLSSRKDVLNLRIKNIEKQENKIREDSKKIQEEVMGELKSCILR